MLFITLLVISVTAAGLLFAYFMSPTKASLSLVAVSALVAVPALALSSDLRQLALLVSPFLLPIVLVAATLSLVSGQLVKNGHPLLGGLVVLPLVYWLWNAHSKEDDKAAVLAGAIEYVRLEPRLSKLAGTDHSKPVLALYRYDSHEKIRQLEYTLTGSSSPLYAIVDVRREWGKRTYTLACVTALDAERRDRKKDACSQSPIELPLRP